MANMETLDIAALWAMYFIGIGAVTILIPSSKYVFFGMIQRNPKVSGICSILFGIVHLLAISDYATQLEVILSGLGWSAILLGALLFSKQFVAWLVRLSEKGIFVFITLIFLAIGVYLLNASGYYRI